MRYFFDLHNDIETVDGEGVDLPDLEAAQAYARKEVQAMAAHSVGTLGHLILRHNISVRDSAGFRVATITFGDVIRVEI